MVEEFSFDRLLQDLIETLLFTYRHACIRGLEAVKNA